MDDVSEFNVFRTSKEKSKRDLFAGKARRDLGPPLLRSSSIDCLSDDEPPEVIDLSDDEQHTAEALKRKPSEEEQLNQSVIEVPDDDDEEPASEEEEAAFWDQFGRTPSNTLRRRAPPTATAVIQSVGRPISLNAVGLGRTAGGLTTLRPSNGAEKLLGALTTGIGARVRSGLLGRRKSADLIAAAATSADQFNWWTDAKRSQHRREILRSDMFRRGDRELEASFINRIMTSPSEKELERAWEMFLDVVENRGSKPYYTVTNLEGQREGEMDVDESTVFSVDECVTLEDYFCLNIEANPVNFAFLYSDRFRPEDASSTVVCGRVRDACTSKAMGKLEGAKDIYVMLRFSDVFVEWDTNLEPQAFGVTTHSYRDNMSTIDARHYYLKGMAHDSYQRISDQFSACLQLSGEIFVEALRSKYPKNYLPDKPEKDEDEEDEDDEVLTPDDEAQMAVIAKEANERLLTLRARFKDLCPQQDEAVGEYVLSRFVCDQALSLDLSCEDEMYLSNTWILVELLGMALYDAQTIYEEIDSAGKTGIWLGTGLAPPTKRRKIGAGPRAGGRIQQDDDRHRSTALRKNHEIVCTPIIEKVIGRKAEGFVGKHSVDNSDERYETPMIEFNALPSTCEYLETLSFDDAGGSSEKTYLSKIRVTPHSFRGRSLDSFEVKTGDTVAARSGKVYKILSMWYRKSSSKKGTIRDGLHGIEFLPSRDTVIENAGPAHEVFFADECRDIKLSEIHKRIVLHTRLPISQTQFRVQSQEEVAERYQENLDLKLKGEYFTSHIYDPKTPSFIYDAVKIREVTECDSQSRRCPVCKWKADQEYEQGPSMEKGKLVLNRVRYDVGHTVLIDPTRVACADGTFKKRYTIEQRSPNLQKSLDKYESDHELYPEFDRFSLTQDDRFRLKEMALCLTVGVIEKITKSGRDGISVTIRVLYRWGDTNISNEEFRKRGNPYQLFWSDDKRVLGGKADVDCILGRCYVKTMLENKKEQDEWILGGPVRFFLNSHMSDDEDVSVVLTDEERRSVEPMAYIDAPEHPQLPPDRRLRSVDAFSGAGGLSYGLHASGVSDTRFAIEWNKHHAAVFRENFPSAVVHTKGINLILDDMIKEELGFDFLTRLPYPRRGEVDLVVGGPPCQGFSGMNSNKSGSDAHGKRSLISAFMTLVSYLRPRFVIMENVNGMSQHRVGAYTKDGGKAQEDRRKQLYLVPLLMEQMKAMGYQVSFRKLQAAQYGVPQDRRRVFLIGAAPGETLPKWPLPITTCGMDYMSPGHNPKGAVFTSFNERMYKPPTWIDDGDSVVEGKEELAARRYDDEQERRAEAERLGAAPLPPITVQDVLSGLPGKARMDRSEQDDRYVTTQNYYANELRNGAAKVEDHVGFAMSPTKKKRLQRIPYPEEFPFADWTCLPNVSEETVSGQIEKLTYKFGTCEIRGGVPAKHRALCPCMRSRKRSDCGYRELWGNCKTMIPACLPHTAIRNKQWEGLYGRVVPWYHFPTIVTKPDLMGKQGRVSHPSEDRYLTVRELARGQGFPDTFRFSAPDPDKRGERIPVSSRYEQIGNAVPPPLSRAIGREIARVLLLPAAQQPDAAMAISTLPAISIDERKSCTNTSIVIADTSSVSVLTLEDGDETKGDIKTEESIRSPVKLEKKQAADVDNDKENGGDKQNVRQPMDWEDKTQQKSSVVMETGDFDDANDSVLLPSIDDAK